MNILVAEDNPFNKILVEKLLDKFGYAEFHHAENGIQVLEKLWHIDPSVPVLLFSGYSQHSIMRYCERDNAIGFLQKPYTINELLLAVHQNLKRA